VCEGDERRGKDLPVSEPRAAVRLVVVPVTPYASFVATNAISPAVRGARSAGSTTFDISTPKSMAPVPKPTSAAPISPPKRACDELEGRPSSQVSMFQTMAPMRPAKISSGVMSTPPSPSRMIPPEMVLATSVDRKAPTRLRIAARPTATLGLRAPVAIGVAMAFAVSWNPFVKSKKRASAMTSTIIRVISTGIVL
jgi:hypothetical protein